MINAEDIYFDYKPYVQPMEEFDWTVGFYNYNVYYYHKYLGSKWIAKFKKRTDAQLFAVEKNKELKANA